MGELFDKERFKKKTEEMKKEDIEESINNLSTIIEYNKDNLEIKRNELNKLKQNDIVKKYIDMESEVDCLSDDIEKNKQKISILKQHICDHNIVYLFSYNIKQLRYNPTFKCICCGKDISGSLDNQICINEDYLNKNDSSYYGSKEEYLNLSNIYSNLKEVNTPFDETVNILHFELERKKYGKKYTYIPLRKETN